MRVGTPIDKSPLLTSASEERHKDKTVLRDSCVMFKMGKDNIMNGKTETVGTIGTQKISGFGAGLLQGIKVSKFMKPVAKYDADKIVETP